MTFAAPTRCKERVGTASLLALAVFIQKLTCPNSCSASSLPRDHGGESVRFVLSYDPLAPIFLFFVEWMGFRCTDSVPTSLGILRILVHKVCIDGLSRVTSHERKATPREFYAIIYPSLIQLDSEFRRIRDNSRSLCAEVLGRGRPRDAVKELEKDDECGICMECRKNTVLPGCGHSMCIDCFSDWRLRPGSCPFCRGSLEGVDTDDLWVLTSQEESIDTVSLALENLRSFYLYVESFPTVIPPSDVLLLD
ncbi:hypothetical protein MLD38_002359 [Melastoma candidum]|uniref:Uncharacterized protein n=1 Tax=Melastoma candidum TaxID=119954 RepID=A0ACB9S257_9MYRT|nr:hypothetical protein MLD38_002359 [Melastoma candidum]